jgi:hypothetical protein
MALHGIRGHRHSKAKRPVSFENRGVSRHSAAVSGYDSSLAAATIERSWLSLAIPTASTTITSSRLYAGRHVPAGINRPMTCREFSGFATRYANTCRNRRLGERRVDARAISICDRFSSSAVSIHPA